MAALRTLWAWLSQKFDDSTFFEFFYSLSVVVYGAAFLITPPEDVASVRVLMELLPGYWWPAISVAVGLVQMICALGASSRAKMVAAFASLIWAGMQCMFGLGAIGVASTMAQLAILGIAANGFVIFRHAGQR